MVTRKPLDQLTTVDWAQKKCESKKAKKTSLSENMATKLSIESPANANRGEKQKKKENVKEIYK
jgi:hypothetical protein